MNRNDITYKTDTSDYIPATLAYEQWKNDFLRVVLRLVSLLLLIAVISAFSVNTLSTNFLYLSLVFILALAGFISLPYSIRGFVLLATLFLVGTNLLLLWGIKSEATMIYLGVITLTALLYEGRFEFITLALVAASILLVAALTINGQHFLSGWTEISSEAYAILVSGWIDWVVYLIDVSVFGLILVYAIRLFKGKFNTNLVEARRLLNELSESRSQLVARINEKTTELNAANQQITRRASQMQVITEFFESIAQIQDMSKLLQTATILIGERFGFYHVGIFSVDSNKEYAILQASNSEVGKKLLARKYRLRVGLEGLVGFVTGRGQTRISIDGDLDSTYFDNPDMPDTHLEIVIPLKIGEDTIGALDLQSSKAEKFSQDDIEVFSILANQLAIAIQNVRSFEEAHQAVKDSETAYRQLTGESWSQFMQSREVLGYNFNGVETKSIIEQSKSENAHVLTIPVRLRGQEIGKIKLSSLEANHVWSEDEIAMAESAAERAALSLENARLLEAAHRRAAKERTISEGATRMSAALDVESILEATAKELERALNSSEVVIQLE